MWCSCEDEIGESVDRRQTSSMQASLPDDAIRESRGLLEPYDRKMPGALERVGHKGQRHPGARALT